LKQIRNFFRLQYDNITSSIAFYPVLISFLFGVFSFIMLTLERQGLSKYMVKHIPFFVINNYDTAIAILNVLIGSIISLIVFSFSSVLVVLNQAANNLSPRLLPGLISNKKHQFVLGVYMGTIIYALLIAINTLPKSQNDYQLPSTSVFVAVVFGIISLTLFVYFISTISDVIQVSSITNMIYNETQSSIETFRNNENLAWVEEESDFPGQIRAAVCGYLRYVDVDTLCDRSRRMGVIVKVRITEGQFILLDSVVMETTRQLNADERKSLVKCIYTDEKEAAGGHFNIGFQQLNEIVIKAMSPGINDPGTAVNALDYIANLLTLRMKLNPFNAWKEKDCYVLLCVIGTDQLLHSLMAGLRPYVHSDRNVLKKILEILVHLSHLQQVREADRQAIDTEIRLLLKTVRLHIQVGEDLDELSDIARQKASLNLL